VETKASASEGSLGWLGVWRIALFHPSRKAFSGIVRDPKASIGWGIAWMAIASLLVWLVGPQRPLLTGWVADMIGLDAVVPFLLVGAPVAAAFGVVSLVITAAISHGLARLFAGAGAYHQLVFCWGIIPLPYVLLSGLATYLPSLFPTSGPFMFSPAWRAVQFATLFILVAIALYLAFVQVVAYGAVEQIGIAKSLGILILQALILGVALACLSFATSQLLSTV
jgi:hypothetical protein